MQHFGDVADCSRRDCPVRDTKNSRKVSASKSSVLHSHTFICVQRVLATAMHLTVGTQL
uniref:Uncharacterized protein n=1 Tax=Globisporangium ultimum (strain ATCC 200006 / CBS 805.95 / DAOM BR144) TaxID=431595 RepID=K3XD85_GLOUD